MKIAQIVAIQMPTAESAHTISSAIKESKEAERRAKTEEDKAKCRADYPRFIKFINKQIEDAVSRGENSISFSFDDEEWRIHDNRCSFTFKGVFYPEHARELDKLYKDLGFRGWIDHLYCVNDRCYRSGSVYLWW